MDVPRLQDIKNWNAEIEDKITQIWKEVEPYKFDPKSSKPIYSIDTPPPYINAPIHMGHAVTYSYMDFFARYKRMKGFQVLFPLGLDRNGLPIELGAEKKYKITPWKVGRDEFIKYCKRLLNEMGDLSTDSFRKLGISFNSWKEGTEVGQVYMTDSPEYRALTQTTFIDLFKKGIIYEATRINNWDPKLRTTIADSEIDYKDLPSIFNDVRWKIKETGEEVIIATTRPELICTCAMVIYHPDDDRYKKLEGKTAITPIFGKEVPIKAHPFADPEKGSGLVMMCSAGDLTDIQFFREQRLKAVIAINKDGTMNEHAGLLQGLKVKAAREKIIEELKSKNLIAKQENIVHRTPVSERSKAEIEFIEMPEFYLKQLDIKKDIAKISKELAFYPEESRKILDSWIETISIDWPISRRRYYATPIPLWYADDLTAIAVPGKYYVPWREQPPQTCEVMKNGKVVGTVKDFPNKKWTGETRVLDTWFDSSISELYVLGYKRNNEFFSKAYPASLRPQGKEIVRTWLYYTILRGYLETGKACFKDVWVHQHICDKTGRKMSKSLGNIIDPSKLITSYGAEALRLWSATEGNLANQDLKCSEQKIQGEMKTLNKLLNVTRFILQFDKPDKKPELNALDQLYVDYIEDLIAFTDKNYSEYEFHKPMLKVRHFLWELLASNYIELVKNRAYNQNNEYSEQETNAAKWTLHYLLKRLVTLAYPVIPQLCSTIGTAIGIDLHNTEFPKANQGKSNLTLLDALVTFNGEIWKKKKEKGIALNATIEGISIPENLKIFEKDLKSCHKI